MNVSILKHEAVDAPAANRRAQRAVPALPARRWADEILVQATDRVGIQFLRYLVVGGVATIFDFGLFLLLTAAGVHYLIANVLAFAVGVSVNYAISVRWVFSSRAMESKLAEFLIFVVVGVAGLGISEAALFVGVKFVHLSLPLAKLGAIGGALVWNFAARKLLLFRGSALVTVEKSPL